MEDCDDGVLFDIGDKLELFPPIEIVQVTYENIGTTKGNTINPVIDKIITPINWTAMCRIYFPLDETLEELVLFESQDGLTNHFFIKVKSKRLGVRDDNGEETTCRFHPINTK